ncbi:hypothetical protein KW797_00420 [Candidatus Parcubacteria bacterium]|nr:hypothetical protein [Candidatus Parcubacteria bacterium]
MPYTSQPLTFIARYAAVIALTTISMSGTAYFLLKGATGQPIQVWQNHSGVEQCRLSENGAFSGNCTSGLGGGTGITLGSGDARYVKKQGDTMTGSLKDTKNVIVQGTMTGNHLYVGTISGAGLSSCNGASQSIQWNSSTLRFECTTIAGGAVFANLFGTGANMQVAYWTGQRTLSGAKLWVWNQVTQQMALGTATPKAKLTVVGSGSFTKGLSGNTLAIQSGGYVLGRLGIGTNSPDTSLEIVGTASGRVVHVQDSITNSGSLSNLGTAIFQGVLRAIGSVNETAQNIDRLDIGVQTGSPRIVFEDSGNVWEVDNNAGTFRWYTPGVSEMELTSTTLTLPSNNLAVGGTGISYVSGSFGVGTTAPETSLEVIGTASGRILHAQDGLSSSGTFTVKGTSMFQNTLSVRGAMTGYSLVVDGTTTFGGHAYNWSTTQGTVGQVLRNDGSDNLSWVAQSGGGGGGGNLSGSGAVNQVATYTGVNTLSGANAMLYNFITRQLSLGSIPGKFKARFNVTGSSAITGSMSGNTILVQSGGYVRGRLAIGKTTALTNLDVLGTVSGSMLYNAGPTIFINGHTFTYPSAQGTNGQTLANNGSDTFTWISPQPLDATLTALAAYNTNGILTQTAADTFAGRTVTGTSNRITVTNGDGVAGNPTLDISSSYVGQTTITTLGGITTSNRTGVAANIIGIGSGKILHAEDTVSSSGALAIKISANFEWMPNCLIMVTGSQGGVTCGTSAVNGGVLYSTSSAVAITPAGSSGQVLRSTGAGAPTFGGLKTVKSLMWVTSGGASVGSGVITGTLKTQYPLTLRNIDLFSRMAPQGQALIADIKVNNVSVFSTKPQIAAGALTGGNAAVFSSVNVASGATIFAAFTQVGTTGQGTGITIQLTGTAYTP